MNTVDKTGNLQLYLAPLHGFTDFVYRKAFLQVFQGIDAYFVPYISVKNNEVLRKYLKEILPANNQQNKVIPQVLAANSEEMLFMCKLLSDYGYSEINLNLGCPYPMVTNRGMGAGLLPFPEKIGEMLSVFFEKTNLKLSVKMRAGLVSDNEIEKVVLVLNRFPLTEVIVHPRVAKQLYAGEISDKAFAFAKTNMKHSLVYNGDINSVEIFKTRNEGVSNFMLGRGVLMNPFLPAEIKGNNFNSLEKGEMLFEFHRLILQGYTEVMDNEGNVLNKMQQFWTYFSHNFAEPHKCFKNVKKANRIGEYQKVTNSIFSRY